jgi:hypothetical protein
MVRQARSVVAEDLVPVSLASVRDDAAYVGDRHVDGPKQSDDSGRTGLTSRVVAVAG